MQGSSLGIRQRLTYGFCAREVLGQPTQLSRPQPADMGIGSDIHGANVALGGAKAVRFRSDCLVRLSSHCRDGLKHRSFVKRIGAGVAGRPPSVNRRAPCPCRVDGRSSVAGEGRLVLSVPNGTLLGAPISAGHHAQHRRVRPPSQINNRARIGEVSQSILATAAV
jgi:hypothetical protein